MIPEFPNFKKLELSDRDEVRAFTAHYPPYSDFNFASMWSWDVHDDMGLSMLNGNLVVRLTDYLSGKPFYSFLGKNDTRATIHTLLKFSQTFAGQAEIRIVPEASIDRTAMEGFLIEDELDHFDYIYLIDDLRTFRGNRFEVKRNLINRFTRLYPHAEIAMLDIEHGTTRQKILELNAAWVRNKAEEGKDIDATNETAALERFFSVADNDHFLAIGILADSELIACSLSEMVGDYALSHFFKGNEDYAGVYAYLMRECAKIFFSKNMHFFNYEQDLGLPGLRRAKNLFRPAFFLKKNCITLRPEHRAGEKPPALVYSP